MRSLAQQSAYGVFCLGVVSHCIPAAGDGEAANRPGPVGQGCSRRFWGECHGKTRCGCVVCLRQRRGRFFHCDRRWRRPSTGARTRDSRSGSKTWRCPASRASYSWRTCGDGGAGRRRNRYGSRSGWLTGGPCSCSRAGRRSAEFEWDRGARSSPRGARCHKRWSAKGRNPRQWRGCSVRSKSRG